MITPTHLAFTSSWPFPGFQLPGDLPILSLLDPKAISWRNHHTAQLILTRYSLFSD